MIEAWQRLDDAVNELLSALIVAISDGLERLLGR